MDLLLRPGMRLARALSVPGKFLFLAVLVLLPLSIGVATAPSALTDRTAGIDRERAGLSYIQPLVRLQVQIGQVRGEIVAGGHPEMMTLSTVTELDALDAQLGEVLGVRGQWPRTRLLLNQVITEVQRGRPAEALPSLRMAMESVLHLIVEVSDTSGLVLDGSLDGHYVALALVTRLPTVIDAISRSQEAAADQEDGASGLEARLAASNLAERTERLQQTLDQAWRASEWASLRHRTRPDAQALRAAVSVLAESVATRDPRDTEPLPSMHPLWAAALDLGESLGSSLDTMLADRAEVLAAQTLRYRTYLLAGLLLATYLFAALYRATTQDVRVVLADISTITSGGIHQTRPLSGRDELAEMSRAVVYARDQLTALVGALRYQATHDDVTALGNRTLLTEKLEEVLTPAEGQFAPSAVAVVIMDLDGFKDVNDSFGQGIGDHVLRLVGARFSKAARRRDIVVRLSADDFGVLLPEISGEREAREIVSRLQESLSQPVVVGGRRLRLRVNAGIALGRSGEIGAAELLRNADVAKYAAQELDGHVAVFEPSMHQRARERTELSADLVGVTEQGEMTLMYQPIVDLRSGLVHGAEALVRWQHPVRGDISPEVFVPLAEATGLIQPIGRWVLREAANQLVSWRNRFPDAYPLTLDVNLSAAQLTDEALVGDILSIIDETGVDPRSLVLEITESALMVDIDTALRRLGQLAAIGVHLALDDFGTGYSSLSYLRRLPVSILKIDKSFVAGLAEPEGHSAALLRSIVGLGASLGMQTVAEGIENAEQEALLREAGCHLGQGFRYSRPVGGEAFTELLQRHRPGVPWPRTSPEGGGPAAARQGAAEDQRR